MKNTSRKPYIYKVTNLETHQYYIGSQCIGKTIGVNYFTSSTNKEFMDDFKNYREEKYKIEIIKEFDDSDECGRVENYIIRNYMLKRDGLCLNRFYCCNGKKVFSRVGTHGWNKGIPRSEETKQKISLTHKGTHHSEEARKRISTALKGHPSWSKGTHHSEEARKKISTALKRKISINDTVFESLTEASKYYKVAIPTIRYWAQKKQHNTVYIEK